MPLTLDLFTTPRFHSAWTQLILDIHTTPSENRDPVDQMILDAFLEQVKHPDVLTPEEDELWAQVLRENSPST